MFKKAFGTFLVTLMSFSGIAQSNVVNEQNLRTHIYFLASDSLHGRRTGTGDEKKAAEYIITQFKSDGLKPMGDNHTWKQAFTYTTSKIASSNSTLSIGHQDVINLFILHHDYEVLPFSGNGHVDGKNAANVGYGIVSKETGRDDYAGKEINNKVVIMKPGSNDSDPHSAVNANSDAYNKALTAQQKGAVAVIFVTRHPSELIHLKYDVSKNLPIPVIVLISDTSVPDYYTISAQIQMQDITQTGYNVIGYFDNHATNTVIVGAHYDHLGYGEDGNSLYRGEKAIHNGADDNASGTAAVMELARALPLTSDKHNNYLFVCFSGEELGLYGSKYLAHHLPIDSNKVNYMINMDMLGRYRDEKGIEVGGLGTSPAFAGLEETFKASGFKIHETKSGMGPSDFTSFYLTNHPVIYFFTGTHEDYHKPGDKADKINYNGEANIIQNLIMPVIHTLDLKDKIIFTATKDYDKQSDVPQFKVKLGIIPDYLFEGTGVRVDGVTPGNPAEKAGLKTGDIIVKMEDLNISDLQSYMKALAAFTKGQTIAVQVKRGADNMSFRVTF